jgi:hypothetical protein
MCSSAVCVSPYKERPNFVELRYGELLRFPLPRTRVHRVFWSHHAAFHLRLIYAGWIDSKMSLSPRTLTTFFNQ